MYRSYGRIYGVISALKAPLVFLAWIPGEISNVGELIFTILLKLGLWLLRGKLGIIWWLMISVQLLNSILLMIPGLGNLLWIVQLVINVFILFPLRILGLNGLPQNLALVVAALVVEAVQIFRYVIVGIIIL